MRLSVPFLTVVIGCAPTEPEGMCEPVALADDEAIDGVAPADVGARIDEVSGSVELRTVADVTLPGGMTLGWAPGAAAREEGDRCHPGFRMPVDVDLHADDGTIALTGTGELTVFTADPWLAEIDLEGYDASPEDLGLVALSGTIDAQTASGELHEASHDRLIVAWVLRD
jgi:hypothetical protein